MKVPTIAQFKSMSLKEKFEWIKYESGENLADANTPGFILYDQHNMAIKYMVDKKGKLIKAEAMPFVDGIKALHKFNLALKSMQHQN